MSLNLSPTPKPAQQAAQHGTQQTQGSLRPPRARRSRVDRLTTAWMVLAAVLIAYSQFASLPQPWWTAVHLVTLGVITNAILQWSWYFSRSLLRLPPDDPHSGRLQAIRQVLFNVALVALIASMWVPTTVGTVAAGVAIGLIITWHVVSLVISARTALAARFAVIIRYYVAAGAFLVLGVIYGALVAIPLTSGASPVWITSAQDGLTLAHSLVNGLGWIGLTIAGTLVTLGPTALRTRMEEGAVPRAVRTLPVLVVAVTGATAAATFGLLPLAGVFVLAYTVAVAQGVGLPLLGAAARKPLAEISTWNFTLGIIWSVAGLLWLSAALFTAADPGSLRGSAHIIVAVIGAGGILQILTGALNYLLPVVVGGGPAAVRVGISTMEWGGGFRLALRNGALLLLVPAALVGAPAAPALGAAVAASYLLEVAQYAVVGARQSRAKKERASAASARSASTKGASTQKEAPGER